MDTQIINKFNEIWLQAKENTPLMHKSAICISTIDREGFPQARFVDLKSVSSEGFVFCTAYNSAKGQEISLNPKVALTVWWDHIGYQVRVVGTAEKISEELALEYWQSRSLDAKTVSLTFEQSQVWNELTTLEEHFDANLKTSKSSLDKPAQWGGYIIKPISVEFLKFHENRLHERTKYVKNKSSWDTTILQP
ncbi:pyridoxine/pyridoxamine 5'-phosphate oxidase [Pseudoalteromonas sp. T1lg65]|uniref:pyridoxine/pyridoxamine 5'-phosphate oxidase n=1 Tax=Pseudoalteromonas sp. T1lg65 TaxID=2077101 RepID=UPI003F7A802C